MSLAVDGVGRTEEPLTDKTDSYVDAHIRGVPKNGGAASEVVLFAQAARPGDMLAVVLLIGDSILEALRLNLGILVE